MSTLQESDWKADSAKTTGWVETGVRIKPYWQNENDASQSVASVISAADSQRPSQIVVTSRNGFKIDNARKNFRTDQDIASFREGFKDKIETYKFDAVYSTDANQNFIYGSYFAEATKLLSSGVNSSFLIYGPQGAGKSYTFSGNESKNEKGLIFQVCDDLLGQQTPAIFGSPTSPKTAGSFSRKGSQSSLSSGQTSKGLKVSIFSIYSDEVFDLLQIFAPNNIKQSIRELYEKSQTEVKIVNLTKRNIQMPSEFKQAYAQAIQNLLMLGEQLQEQNYYGKCHIVVQFEIGKSKLSVVRLSDSDIYESAQETAKNDLAVLKRYLNHCSRYNQISPTYKLYKQSKLTYTLRDTLNESTNNRLLCCINNNPAAYINSIKTLDYFGRMTTGTDRSLLQQANANNNNSRLTFDDTRLSNNISNSRYQNPTNENNNNNMNINEQDTQFQPNIKGRSNNNNSIFNTSQTLNTNYNISGNSKSNNNNDTKQIEQIIGECEELMKEVTKMASQSSSVSRQERDFWVGNKNQQIRSLREYLDENMQGVQPRSSLNYCDSLLLSAQRQLGKISQQSPQRLVRNSDSSDDEVQDIKQRIDKQISKLQDSQILEQDRQVNQEQQQLSRLSPRSQISPLRRLTPPRRDLSMSFQNPGNISNNNNTSYIDQERRILEEQDRRRMDFKVKETALRNEELQGQVKAKTEVITQIDREMKNCQDDLLLNMDRMRELEIKQENALRLEEQLRDQNETLKHKLYNKKGKVQVLKAEAANCNRNIQVISEDLSNQVDQLKQVLSDTQKQLDQSEYRGNELLEDIRGLKEKYGLKEEQFQNAMEELEDLRRANARLKGQLEEEQNEKEEKESELRLSNVRLEESRDLVTALEAKNNKMRSQFDIEREDLKDQVEQLKKARKEKNRQFKEYIAEQEERINVLESEKIQAEQVLQANSSNFNETQKETDMIKENYQQAVEEVNKLKISLSNSEVETERLENLVGSLEARVKTLEEGSLLDAKSIQNLRQQLQQETDSNIDLQHINENLEIQLRELEQTQSDQISQIERQVDSLVNEIEHSKALNEEYKSKEDGFKKQIVSLNDVIEALKEKYYKAKHSNKTLKQQLQAFNEKLKQLETDRLLDIKEQEKQQISQMYQQRKETKLRTIDEIQGLISSVKKNRSMLL